MNLRHLHPSALFSEEHDGWSSEEREAPERYGRRGPAPDWRASNETQHSTTTRHAERARLLPSSAADQLDVILSEYWISRNERDPFDL